MHARSRLVSQLVDAGIVAVIRAPSAPMAVEMAQACVDGGGLAIEVSLTTPKGLAAIETLRKRLEGSGGLVGAGTVLDSETAKLAIDAGAQYVVTPSFDAGTVRLCNRYQVPTLAGAMTVAEIVACLEAGVDIVKLFPGETLGPAFLRAVRAPLPQAPLMPTGGVSVANVEAWVRAGACALGVGGSLTGPALEGDLAAVTARAAALVTALRAARDSQRPAPP